ncbi:hypothetical protein FF38_10320 [Lucilia cuprina]|uniref:Uncharacterized protein n=1 Tax=Lucilia cuprina TaxID=7375 RepID=A0A0L0BM49_LUCCU|nr:hypothetical protein FF38_10320 [Lucilia cuprina]
MVDICDLKVSLVHSQRSRSIFKLLNFFLVKILHAYVIISVLKLDTIEFIKFSRIITARIDFQSLAFSPSNKQIDSSANLTTEGGFAIVLTSTSCCLRIDFTADYGGGRMFVFRQPSVQQRFMTHGTPEEPGSGTVVTLRTKSPKSVRTLSLASPAKDHKTE